MDFCVGDKVIHSYYGLGEIVQLDEKEISGKKLQYYVVQVQDLTLWVPVQVTGRSSLRFPTPKSDYESLFVILRSPGEPLSHDRIERKNQLAEKMKDGTLESICTVVRDLTFLRKNMKLNDNDMTLLKRAENFLYNEWIFTLSISLSQAQKELGYLLGENSFQMSN